MTSDLAPDSSFFCRFASRALQEVLMTWIIENRKEKLYTQMNRGLQKSSRTWTCVHCDCSYERQPGVLGGSCPPAGVPLSASPPSVWTPPLSVAPAGHRMSSSAACSPAEPGSPASAAADEYLRNSWAAAAPPAAWDRSSVKDSVHTCTKKNPEVSKKTFCYSDANEFALWCHNKGERWN